MLNVLKYKQTVIFVVLIFTSMIAANFVLQASKNNQDKRIDIDNKEVSSDYCKIIFNPKKCDGKRVKIKGTNPMYDSNHGIDQHPVVDFSFDDNGQFESEQGYLNTKTLGQIILTSANEIDCENKMEIVGILNTNVGPCREPGIGKEEYCGIAVDVETWRCY